MRFRIKRDPVVLMNIIAGVVMGAIDIFVPLTHDQTSLVNAVVLGVANLVAATRVHDGQLVALTGLGKAVLATMLGFGLNLSVDLQVFIMSGVALAGSLWVRSQVAPVDAPTPAALAEPVVEVAASVGNVGTERL
jgi:hypothetical protein